MSDHAWTQEQIAAYVVGGLTAVEVDRADAHVRKCPDCAAALSTARGVDRNLQALFVDIRPGLELEDAAIQCTRTAQPRRLVFTNWLPRLAVAAGVLVAFCLVGAMAEGLMRDGRLPMPGNAMRAPPSTDAEYAQADRQDAARTPLSFSGGQGAPPSDGEIKGVIAGKDEIGKQGGGVHRGFGGGQQGQVANVNGQFGFQGGGSSIGGGGGIGGGIGGGGIGGCGGIGGGNPNSGSLTTSSGALNSPPGTALNLPAPPIVYGGFPQPGQVMGKADPILPSVNSLNKSSAAANSFKPSEQWRETLAAQVKGDKAGGGKTDGDREASDNRFNSWAIGLKPDQGGAPKSQQPAEDAAPRRIVIRSGEMEFEVVSFDAAVASITKLTAGLSGAFVATVNSEKLANGKVRGSVTVRTPPEHLDTLVLDLRRDLGASGELKGMQIGSQDITKQYTDLESRLRAARTMEQRLLQVIKDGKGEIKQLLEAEKELGVWRTKIEEVEGEIRYYSNLAALATLTVTLAEKEIRAAASVTESERVQAGVETEDVDKAYQQTLAAVIDAKGRVTKSELKQLAAGQFNATLQFEVPPEAAGPIRDHLRQLGRMVRLEIDRVQKAADGSTPSDAKVKRGDTLFLVQIYNLANVAPRETVTLQLAFPDVRAGYQALRDAAGKANGRVLTAQLNEQDVQNVTAQVDFEIRRPEEGAIRTALAAAGETIARQVTRASEGDDTTDTKLLYRVTFVATNRLAPRELTTLTLEVQDVEQTTASFAAQVAEAKGRQLASQSARDQNGKVTTRVTYEVPLAAAGIVEKFKSSGIVQTRQSVRDPQAPGANFATARFDLTIVSRDPIVGEDDGLWPQIRRGLTFSMTVLLTSVTWVVFGLCVVLPWGLAGYACYRLFNRLSRARQPLTATSSGKA